MVKKLAFSPVSADDGIWNSLLILQLLNSCRKVKTMLFAFSIGKKKSHFIQYLHLEKANYITEPIFRRLYRKKYFQHIKKTSA